MNIKKDLRKIEEAKKLDLNESKKRIEKYEKSLRFKIFKDYPADIAYLKAKVSLYHESEKIDKGIISHKT